MGIKRFNPVTPSLRNMTQLDYAEITTDRPEKTLVKTLVKHSGRNNRGLITCQDKGGGATLAELQNFIDGFNGGTMWLLNGMKYGLMLEYGHSKKAPQGFVRRNVSRINAIVARISKA